VAQIGKYQVVEQIGEGAMGVVYKAMDPVLNRTVAVKVMSEGLAQDTLLRERFLREAQAAGSLQHPNLVTIYDFGETDGHLFIAMEYIEGADLEDLMSQSTPMPLATKLDLMIDVLNGLSFAHRRGVIHRDIKPANIRIDQEGRARIMDFGVARLSTSNLTGTGTMMGTPNYMAPEQINGGELTPSVDIWSVGAVLYELLSGRKPFQAETLHRVLFRIVSDPPTDLVEVAPGLPTGLMEIVSKALEKDPQDRYKTATEMANVLAAVRARLGAPRMSRTVSQRASIEEALKAKPATAAATAASRFDSRSLAVGGVSAAVIVLGTLGFLALRNNFDTLTPDPVAPPPTATVQTTVVAPPSAAVQRADSVTPRPAPAAPAENRTSTKQLAGATRDARTSTTTRNTPTPPPVAIVRVDTVRVPTAPAAVAASQGSPSSQTTAVTTPPETTTAPVNTPPASPAVPDNPRPAITAIVNDYARAIGTRQVAEIRRIYAGMTTLQQSQWESFFGAVRSIQAALDIASLSVDGNTAVARVTGGYEFISRTGRAERQPASFEATFERDGDRWVMRRVR
jgi:serine/threonine protein kinase